MLACAGAKEAIFHLPLAFAGDPARRKVVMPDPGYPTYEVGRALRRARAGEGPAHRRPPLPARARGRGRGGAARDARSSGSRYPHNPTGAVAPRDYLRRVGEAARRYGFMVASDECYADVYFGAPPPSMLEVQVENVVAVHSCSKRSGMTGYRSRLPRRRPGPHRGAALAAEPPRRGVAGVRGGGGDRGVVRRRAPGGAARDLPAEAGSLPRASSPSAGCRPTPPRRRSTCGCACRAGRPRRRTRCGCWTRASWWRRGRRSARVKGTCAWRSCRRWRSARRPSRPGEG